MSVLIRTGPGKTDLSYTDDIKADLKVLQKTGNKSVQWITIQPGQTYDNILQKNSSGISYGSIEISRTKVTIPSLTGTSFACVGNPVGPGVNNLNTDLVTQSGTLSTTGIGSYTVYWDLKDPDRYCWSDGTTTRKSQNWSTYAGTATFHCYEPGRWDVSFNIQYGVSIKEACKNGSYYNKQILANGDSNWYLQCDPGGKPTRVNVNHVKSRYSPSGFPKEVEIYWGDYKPDDRPYNGEVRKYTYIKTVSY